MNSQQRAEEIIGKAMAELAGLLAEDTDSAQPMCTNYVLVAEWSTLDGQQWISRWWDSSRPEWQRDGLLYHGLRGDWNGDER